MTDGDMSHIGDSLKVLPPGTPETPHERAARHAREAEEHFRKKGELAVLRSEQSALAAKMQPRPTLLQATRDRACEDCGKTFHSSALVDESGGELFAVRRCPTCLESGIAKREAEAYRARARMLAEAWEDICPPDYIETNTQRLLKALPSFAVVGGVEKVTSAEDLYDRVVNWTDKGEGIIMAGETGIGKTRLMLVLMRRYHDAGRAVRYVNMAIINDRIAGLFSESAAAADRYIRAIEVADIVFMDDLGKQKMTERAEETLYRILETRRSHRRRTFFTANYRPSDLKAKMSEDRGGPIIRRIRDLAIAFNLFQPTPTP